MVNSTPNATQEVTETTPDTPAFRTQLANLVEGQRVRVESAAGKRFEGTFEDVLLTERQVLLRNAEELPGGATFPTACVAGVDWIAQVDDNSG